MSDIGKELKLNRAERRKLAKDAKKETGKPFPQIVKRIIGGKSKWTVKILLEQ